MVTGMTERLLSDIKYKQKSNQQFWHDSKGIHMSFLSPRSSRTMNTEETRNVLIKKDIVEGKKAWCI